MKQQAQAARAGSIDPVNLDYYVVLILETPLHDSADVHLAAIFRLLRKMRKMMARGPSICAGGAFVGYQQLEELC